MNYFAETLDLIPVACYRLNKESTVTYVNRYALDYFNKSNEECIGQNIWELFPESKVTRCFDAINTALTEGNIATHDYVSAVSLRWIRLTATPVNDGVVVSFVDIHDLRQNTKTEDLSRSGYETLFNVMDEGFCVIEKISQVNEPVDFIYVTVNPAFERHTGLSNVIGKTIRQLIPAIESNLLERYDEAITTGQPQHFDEYVSGIDMWMEAKLFALAQPNRLAILFNNINARKKAELALQQNEQRLKAIFEVLPVGVAVADRSGKFILSNPEMDRYIPNRLMPSKDEQRGKYWQAWDEAGNLIPPQQYPGAKALAGKYVVPGIDMLYTDEQGKQTWTNVSAIPIRDERGEVIAQVAVINNITLHKQNEEALRRSEQLYKASTEKYLSLFSSIDQGFCIVEVIFKNGKTPVDYKFLEVNEAFAIQNGLYNAVNKTMREMNPDMEEHWFQIYGDIALTGVPKRFEERSDALNRWFDVYAFRIGSPEEHKVAILFSDITAKKDHEMRQAFLLEVSDIIRTLADSTTIEQAVTQATMNYMNADRCYYCEVDNGKAIICTDAHRDGLPSLTGTYPLEGFALFNAIVDTGRTFVVNNINNIHNIDPELKALCLQLQKTSFIDVPVIKGGKIKGILCLVQNKPRVWKPVELDLAEEVADRVWAAVERAKGEKALLRSEAEKLRLQLEDERRKEILRVILTTQEEERQRISESLHNGLGQLLYAVQLSLANLTAASAVNDAKAYKTDRQYTDKLLADAIRESRKISHELMPTILQEFGLKAAVEDVCSQMSDAFKLKCTIKLSDRKLDKLMELAIYRTFQELLINVLKHARATQVKAQIIQDDDHIAITVADNGIGFTPAPQQKGGIGLASIQSKADLLNGHVKIISSAGNGTQILVTIPI